jgi:hypothetical protein
MKWSGEWNVKSKDTKRKGIHVELIEKKLEELIPYINNPRKNDVANKCKNKK